MVNDPIGSLFPGTRVGTLTLVERVAGSRKWLCRCDCGRTKEIFSTNLYTGRTRSCKMCNGYGPYWKQWQKAREFSVWESFEVFAAAIHPRPSPQHRLFKKNDDEPHGPDNWEWLTLQEWHGRNRQKKLVEGRR